MTLVRWLATAWCGSARAPRRRTLSLPVRSAVQWWVAVTYVVSEWFQIISHDACVLELFVRAIQLMTIKGRTNYGIAKSLERKQLASVSVIHLNDGCWRGISCRSNFVYISLVKWQLFYKLYIKMNKLFQCVIFVSFLMIVNHFIIIYARFYC